MDLGIPAWRGFTVIGVDYSLAPGHRYPTPIRQLNEALACIRAMRIVSRLTSRPRVKTYRWR